VASVDTKYYRMQPGQESEVTDLIYALMAEYGTNLETKLTPEAIKDTDGFLNIEIAEANGKIIGICAWVMSFSTWRGLKGMHVADHFVTRSARKTDTARKLLHFAAKSAASQGAQFIRTEIDISDEFAEELYAEVGFWYQTRHTLHFLERSKFNNFIAKG
jgi:GNAT superfamily N-acetyltransferase